mgnify:CR=1 FL=1
MREAICISKHKEDLTFGKRYVVLGQGGGPGEGEWSNEFILIENDGGKEVWYDMCQYGIIYLILFNGKWCKYIGPISEGLTYEESYELLEKKNDDYHIITYPYKNIKKYLEY